MIGKLAIPIVNMLIFYIMISLKEKEFFYVDFITPLIFSALCSYCVSRIFFGMGDEIILAFLMSIIVDLDLNMSYNSHNYPKYGPE